MYFLQFWKSWPSFQQRLFWILAGLAIVTLILLWVSNFYFPAPVFTARTFHQLELTEFSSHSFHLGAIEFHVPADVILIFERTIGDSLKPDQTASYIFLVVFMLSIIPLLSIISGLSRFWFYSGLALLALFVFSLNLELIKVFGLTNRIPTAISFLALGIPAYYFQFLSPASTFVKRLLVFGVILSVIGAVIFQYATVPHPFTLIVASSIIPAALLMVVFILMIAPEILFSLLVVISRGNKQTKSLQHFLIISTIYLANLALMYMNKKHLIEWSFIPVNLFLFATFSGIFGLWGFRQREILYAEIIEANPRGVFLYLSLAAIGFGTMGYFIATANDPVIHFTQDVILYSHLGYGIIFVIYVISNFASMLVSNFQVYRVMYKPTTMPYFTFRLAGLITTFTFFAYSNWKVSVDQVSAAYFNAYGDAYITQDTLLAEGYYRRSLFHALRNYHSHYALAQISASRGEGEAEKDEYQKLVDSRPIDLAYLNLNRTYERDNALTKSVHILKSGLQDFPNNGKLENELGMVFAKLNMKDSAWYFINLAKGYSASRPAAETNLLGLAAKFNLHVPYDSMLSEWGPEKPGLKSNGLALACMEGKTLATLVDPGKDSILTIYSITALHNYLLNQRNQTDTALISKTIRLGRQNPDPYYSDFLLSGAAYASYANGQVLDGIRLLRELALANQEEKYYNVIGLWALEQNTPDRAAKYFDEALKQGLKSAFFNKAIALTESLNIPSALEAWDSLSRSPDISISRTAAKMTRVLKASPQQATQLGEEEKYLYLRYRIALDDDDQFEKLINTLKDTQMKARALIDRSKKLDKADEVDRASATLALTKELTSVDKDLYPEIAHLNLLFIARQKNWNLLGEQMHTGILFNGKYKLDKLYLDALLNAQAGKKEEAHKGFAFLSRANPFFEDGMVAAIDFLNLDTTNRLKNYSLLVDALELNPNSIKLLKAHLILSAQLDFEENLQSSLDKLGTLMSHDSFLRFLKENPKLFAVTPN